MPFDTNCFINCPFDQPYEKKLSRHQVLLLQKLSQPMLGLHLDQALEEDTGITGDLYTQEDFDHLEKMLEGVKPDTFENTRSFIQKTIAEDFSNQTKFFAKSQFLLNSIEALKQQFPHFIEVIEHIENHCILQNIGSGVFYVPPLLLAGGAGIGKTFFCHTMANLVQTFFRVLNMESISSNFQLTGSNEGWGTASPGIIFKALTQGKQINPIFLLDELDKCKGDERYSASNAFLPLLERYTALSFKDECVSLPLDASHIIWIATANELEKISAPLKSRFDIFTVPSPNFAQRRQLIKGIYSSILTMNSWGHSLDTSLSGEVLDLLAEMMSPGAARDLRRTITTACARAVKDKRHTILNRDIDSFALPDRMMWDLPLVSQ